MICGRFNFFFHFITSLAWRWGLKAVIENTLFEYKRKIFVEFFLLMKGYILEIVNPLWLAFSDSITINSVSNIKHIQYMLPDECKNSMTGRFVLLDGIIYTVIHAYAIPDFEIFFEQFSCLNSIQISLSHTQTL